MISHISIKDFAIIDSISLDFHQGFHICTGETGAGKSIIIEAINLALGSRADTAYVRSGCDKAIIELTAETSNKDVLAILRENQLGSDNTIHISREIHAGGKSVCRINGIIVSVSFLNRLCKKIADIHGQYDHQSLLNPENHLLLLDQYDAANILPMKEKVKKIYHTYSDTKKELETYINDRAQTMRKRDFMQFELEEIKAAKLWPGEEEELSKNLLLLQNSEQIYNNLSMAYELLYEQNASVFDNLGKSMNLLSQIQSYTKDMEYIWEVISDCYYKLEDLQSYIRKTKDGISFSPKSLNETVERLDQINRLKNKYGNTIDDILEYMEKIQKEFNITEDLDVYIENLEKDMNKYKEELIQACKHLTSLRKQAANKLEADINNELKELNFKNTNIHVTFKEPDGEGYTENGQDHVEFMIVTNQGELPKPLVKIASGGEVSRIMLAFKCIIGNYDQIPTLIFDEIDSGISGITASIVGKKLKKISTDHQVICITHLPQIAAFSDHHYRITKEEKQKRTITRVSKLNDEEKIYEVARLLGGISITENTLNNAKELISLSRL